MTRLLTAAAYDLLNLATAPLRALAAAVDTWAADALNGPGDDGEWCDHCSAWCDHTTQLHRGYA